MKNIGYALCAVFFLPCTLFAQTPEIEETIYIVRQQNRVPVPLENCDWAKPFLGVQPLRSANLSDLYAVHTKDTDGSILNDDVNKVGKVLGCTAEPTPELERGFQTGDFGEVWQVTLLNGKEYTVTGSNRLRTDPVNGPGFPMMGMSLSTQTGTVYKSFATDWPPVVVGAMSGNFLADPLEIGGFDELAILSFSLYEPPAKKVWTPTGNGWELK